MKNLSTTITHEINSKLDLRYPEERYLLGHNEYGIPKYGKLWSVGSNIFRRVFCFLVLVALLLISWAMYP